MSGMFWGCASLAYINISSFNTKNVVNMENLFNHCSSLRSIDLSNFNTQNVTSMNFMFYDCHNLINVDISHFTDTSLKKIAAFFHDIPSSGIIKVNKDFISYIESVIPEDWDIRLVDNSIDN